MHSKAIKWILVGILGIIGILRFASTIVELVSAMTRVDKKITPLIVTKYLGEKKIPNMKELMPKSFIIASFAVLHFIFLGFLLVALALDLPAKLYNHNFPLSERQVHFEESEERKARREKIIVSIGAMVVFVVIASIYADFPGIYTGIGPFEEYELLTHRFMPVLLGGMLGLLAAFFKPSLRRILLLIPLLFFINAILCIIEWSLQVNYCESQSKPQPPNLAGAIIQDTASQYGLHARFGKSGDIPCNDLAKYVKSPFTEFLFVNNRRLSGFQPVGSSMDDQKELDPSLRPVLVAVTIREIVYKLNNTIIWKKILLSIPSLTMSILTALNLAFPNVLLTPWGLTVGNAPLISAIVSAMCYTGAINTILSPFYLWWRRSCDYGADEVTIAKGYGKGLATYLAAEWRPEADDWEFSWLFEKLNMNEPSKRRRLENIDRHLAKK